MTQDRSSPPRADRASLPPAPADGARVLDRESADVPGTRVAAVQQPRRWSTAALAPLAIFALLAAVFGFALQRGDPSRLPSALIGRMAPALALPPVEGLVEAGKAMPGLEASYFTRGQPTVVNFWASWCAPCVEEHPALVRLRERTGVAIVGINHKDQAANARRFLSRYGNPFAVVAADRDGRAAIEWGVYGMPETFIVDGQGRIAYKHVGPISPEALEQRILPALERAKAAR